MGLKAPNHTQIPNEIFDEWLPKLGLAELKVLMVIMRKTFGWHKIRDRISLGQLEKLTGLERRHILKATKTLSEKGLISKIVEGKLGTQETYYELVIEDCSNNSYQCPKDPPPSVFETPTKETLKENISPIVPKRDLPFSKPKKTIKEEKLIVAERVMISKSQHDNLLKRANGNLALVKAWYDRLSSWKIGKEIYNGANDYQSIIKWVIDAVTQVGSGKDQVVDKDQQLAEKIAKKYPNHKGIIIGRNYIEFPDIHLHLKFGEGGFVEQVISRLRKMNLPVDGL